MTERRSARGANTGIFWATVVIAAALLASIGASTSLVHSQSAGSTHYRQGSTNAASLGYAASTSYRLYSANGEPGGSGIASSASYRAQVGWVRRAALDAPPPVGVGGVAERPDPAALPPSSSASSGDQPTGYVFGAAAVAALAMVAAAGWTIRRRHKGGRA